MPTKTCFSIRSIDDIHQITEETLIEGNQFKTRAGILEISRHDVTNRLQYWWLPTNGRSQQATIYDDKRVGWDFPGAIPPLANSIVQKIARILYKNEELKKDSETWEAPLK